MDCTIIVVGADDIVMNETDKMPIFREQMAPATNIADCLGLTICPHLSTPEAGPIIPNPPLSLPWYSLISLGELRRHLLIFLILLVIIGDHHHDNTITGTS